jgi:hypothetical protein
VRTIGSKSDEWSRCQRRVSDNARGGSTGAVVGAGVGGGASAVVGGMVTDSGKSGGGNARGPGYGAGPQGANYNGSCNRNTGKGKTLGHCK